MAGFETLYYSIENTEFMYLHCKEVFDIQAPVPAWHALRRADSEHSEKNGFRN